MSKLILKPALAITPMLALCSLFLLVVFQPTKAVSEPFALAFVGVTDADLTMATNDITGSSYLDTRAAHSYSEPSMLIDYTWVYSNDMAVDAEKISQFDMRASAD
jgi:hypothetical protein